MINKTLVLFPLSFSFLILIGCPLSKEAGRPTPKPSYKSRPTPPTPSTQIPKESKTITTASGLQFKDLLIGTGPIPAPGQRVLVHYTGWLKNGTKFDSSLDRGQPFAFTLGQGQVIKGWDEGLSSMKVGGKRKLIIPPELGYGAQGAGNIIPPNSTLIFDVELLEIQ